MGEKVKVPGELPLVYRESEPSLFLFGFDLRNHFQYTTWLILFGHLLWTGHRHFMWAETAKGQDNLLYYHYHYYSEGFKKYKCGPASLDPYFTAFRKKKIYRESCYQCKFACGERCGDFTIGDYWKVEQFHPELEGITGVSILCINSKMGMATFEGFKDKLLLVESNMDNVLKVCTNIREPSTRPLERDKVYKYIAEHGYEAWANKYLKSKRYKLMRIYEALPGFVRIPLKRTIIKMSKML